VDPEGVKRDCSNPLLGQQYLIFVGSFGEKVGNNHVPTQRLSQTNLLSGNLASASSYPYRRKRMFFAKNHKDRFQKKTLDGDVGNIDLLLYY
jgi:hypothetical protein